MYGSRAPEDEQLLVQNLFDLFTDYLNVVRIFWG